MAHLNAVGRGQPLVLFGREDARPCAEGVGVEEGFRVGAARG
ncbi:MAG TPA: hypothetical protein VN282_11040 [Pyrinomonadaceae bacterium]|nr:hypothetical protein [Pyrinomonadaceae bacterium]